MREIERTPPWLLSDLGTLEPGRRGARMSIFHLEVGGGQSRLVLFINCTPGCAHIVPHFSVLIIQLQLS